MTWADETRNKINALGQMPKAASVDPDASDRAGHEIHRRAIGNYLVYDFIDDARSVVVIEGFRAWRTPTGI